jgi:hypothetical protein
MVFLINSMLKILIDFFNCLLLNFNKSNIFLIVLLLLLLLEF